jgi:murein DD-endopeptidase MepM/ murein hydrolase activator NlpD
MSAPSTPLSALPGLRPLASNGASENPARVRELAHQFESLFIAQMLRQMRQSMTMMGEDGEEGEGAKTFGAMSETIDSELARQLSEAGGMGIADVIIDSFERQRQAAGIPAVEPGTPRSLAAPPATAVPLNAPPVAIPAVRGGGGAAPPEADLPDYALRASSWSRRSATREVGKVRPTDDHASPADLKVRPTYEATAVSLPVGQTVTSAFGWRADPLTGEGRFHKGVDVRAAYGQQIPAVANGTVVSAGPAGGYGLSVVIEHGSGIRTRYAHLSEVKVKAGEAVSRGQDIGRVGNSGRSTGPHLHFEVLAGGRPVDPVQAAARFRVLGELKEVETGADSVNGWPSAAPAAEE